MSLCLELPSYPDSLFINKRLPGGERILTSCRPENNTGPAYAGIRQERLIGDPCLQDHTVRKSEGSVVLPFNRLNGPGFTASAATSCLHAMESVRRPFRIHEQSGVRYKPHEQSSQVYDNLRYS